MFAQTENPLSIYHFTLLRHGESTGNAGGYYLGQADFPLSEKGRRQATALADYWSTQKVRFDQIISSPLAHARQTAEVIAGVLNLQVEFNPSLMERDAGMLSGLHHEEANALYPRPAFMYPYLPVGVNGESQWELYLRGGRTVQELVDQQPGSYLVVSHGGILNMVMYAMLNITPQANFYGPRFRFSNTGYARLTYTPLEHAWRVLSVNEHRHWEEAAETEGPGGGDL